LHYEEEGDNWADRYAGHHLGGGSDVTGSVASGANKSKKGAQK